MDSSMLIKALSSLRKPQMGEYQSQEFLHPSQIPLMIPSVIKQVTEGASRGAQNKVFDYMRKEANMKPPDEITQDPKKESAILGGAGLLSLLLPKKGRGIAINDFLRGYEGAKNARLQKENRKQDREFELEKTRVQTEGKIAQKQAEIAQQTNSALDAKMREAEGRKVELFRMILGSPDEGSVQEKIKFAEMMGYAVPAELREAALKAAKDRTNAKFGNEALDVFQRAIGAPDHFLPSERLRLMQFGNELWSKANGSPRYSEAELESQFNEWKSKYTDSKVIPKINSSLSNVRQEIGTVINNWQKNGVFSPSDMSLLKDWAVRKFKQLLPDLSQSTLKEDDLINLIIPVDLFSSGLKTNQATMQTNKMYAEARLAIQRERFNLSKQQAFEKSNPKDKPSSYAKQGEQFKHYANLFSSWMNLSDDELYKKFESSSFLTDEDRLPLRAMGMFGVKPPAEAIRNILRQKIDGYSRIAGEYDEMDKIVRPSSQPTQAGGNLAYNLATGKVEPPKGNGGVPSNTLGQANRGGNVRSGRGGDILTQFQSEYLGTPYVLGGQSKKNVDCSGLVCNYAQAIGKPIPDMTANDIHANRMNWTPVSMDAMERGDVIAFPRKGHGHTGIYIGNGKVLVASSGSGKVVIQDASVFTKNPGTKAYRPK